VNKGWYLNQKTDEKFLKSLLCLYLNDPDPIDFEINNEKLILLNPDNVSFEYDDGFLMTELLKELEEKIEFHL